MVPVLTDHPISLSIYTGVILYCMAVKKDDQIGRDEFLANLVKTPPSPKNKKIRLHEQNQIDQLVEKLSSPKVIERGDAFNKSFNAFSGIELLRKFNI